ncbi:phosphatase PAP2 family protein [Anoxybacillus sp. J5B_2022]|uniref:phosphatase PAP2 family protein n=1 Tax=Anoxybacillus sp. J5B_2022 TaxID=3003246 RepID=UPI00228693EE|nr:phosphatase PAP2 family protein [Anoxybacillus sp. J5B_2022]MCZ0754387.1 phosphatase PAP2 family protein [Anoxybacillus sp. J5B_2022]
MNLKLELTRAFFLSLFSAIIFGLTAFLVSGSQVAHFDGAIISFIQRFESPALTSVMKFFSWIGSGRIVTMISLIALFVLYKAWKYRSELVLFVTVVAGSSILNQLLKSLFHRARPSLHRLAEASGFSFPSGHSMEAVALYGILAFLLWRRIDHRFGRVFLIFISFFMIMGIGVSRIYLGVHYPSDVIGGYFASSFWLFAAIWFYQRYKERNFEKTQFEKTH